MVNAIVKWRAYPALRAVIGVSAGIIIGSLTGIRPSILENLAITAWLINLVFLGLRVPGLAAFYGVFTWMLLISLGTLLQSRQYYPAGNYEKEIKEFIGGGIVKETGPEVEGKCRVIVEIQYLSAPEYGFGKPEYSVWWNTDTFCDLVPGDTVILAGQLIPVKTEGFHGEGFNRYLENRGIRARCYAQRVIIRPMAGQLKWADHLAYRTRMKWVERIKHWIPGENGMFLVSLCLGYRSLSPLTKKDFQVSGAMHVLAISGLHVGIAAGMVRWPISKILPKTLWGGILLRAISQFFIWCFVGISGSSEPAIRAAVMITVWDWGRFLNRKSHWAQLLSISLLIQIYIDPTILFQAGSQLSYSAVTSIMWFSPWIQLAVRYTPRYLQWVSGLLLVSIAAQLGVAGWSLFHFQQFPLLFLFTNFVAIPFATLLLAGGWLLILTDHCWIYASKYLAAVINGLTSFFLEIVSLIASWSPRASQFLELSSLGLLLYYTGIIFTVAWLYSKKKYLLIAGSLFIAICIGELRLRTRWRTAQPAITFWASKNDYNLLVQQLGIAYHFHSGIDDPRSHPWADQQAGYHLTDSVELIRDGVHLWETEKYPNIIVTLDHRGYPQITSKGHTVIFALGSIYPMQNSKCFCKADMIYVPEKWKDEMGSIVKNCPNKPKLSLLGSREHFCQVLDNLPL